MKVEERSGSDVTTSFPASSYAWYVVAVLTLANASAFIDRQVLGLLVAPIRRDLGITDTQMGALYGLAFAVFFIVLGVPIGRLADRASRRTIIATGIAVWSVMTVLCGMARTYEELLLARVGVGIGEAALAAPALSLIADCFPAARRATALSVYALGVFFGAGAANLVGGAVLSRIDQTSALHWPLIGEIRAWQSVFVVVGVPGLIIALLMATVREPARHETGQTDNAVFPVREVVRYLRANQRAFVCHALGYTLFTLVNYAVSAWLPTNLVRTYGWTTARAGITLGSLTITVGVLGVIVGGRVADRMLARGYTDAKLRVGIIAAVANVVFGAAFTLAPNATWSVVALIPYNFFAAFAFGAAFAAIQEITPNRMRAQVGAVYFSVTTLVGLGLGPTLAGLLTDRVFANDAALRYSLLIVTTVGLCAAAVLLAAGLEAYRRSVVYRAEWSRSINASGTR